MKIVPPNLRLCHLQNIIDQSPNSDQARRARELQRKVVEMKPKARAIPRTVEFDDFPPGAA